VCHPPPSGACPVAPRWKPGGVATPLPSAAAAETPASLKNERRDTRASPRKKASRSSWCFVSMLLTAMASSEPRHDDADPGRVLEIGIRRQVAEVALLARRGGDVALRPLSLLRPLAGHLLLSEGGEAVAGERLHE